MEYKKGDIVVRIKAQNGNNTRYEHYKGAMFKIIEISNNHIYYTALTGPYKEDVRLAFMEEVNAFKEGIRNVSEILPILNAHYLEPIIS